MSGRIPRVGNVDILSGPASVRQEDPYIDELSVRAVEGSRAEPGIFYPLLLWATPGNLPVCVRLA